MLACQKHEFLLPDGLHYLNCAYMSPLSRTAEAAGIAGVRRRIDPSRLAPEDFFDESDEARRLFAKLLNIDPPERVAIVPSVSYGIAIAALNVDVRAGQNIVIAEDQFPSNVYAWRALARRRDAELRIVPAPGSATRGEAWNAMLLEAIDAATAVVALPHVHWTDGTRFDLEAIGERARRHGATLILDATQSLGALPLDAAAVRPDAVVCAGYKWLLGPYSLGLAYFGERFDDGVPLEETWIGRRGSEDFRALVGYRDEYQPGAIRYDVGERSSFTLMPTLIASLRQVLGWGPARIQEYCAALMTDVMAEAGALGFTIEDATWRAAHLFGLRAPEHLDLDGLQQALVKRNVSASLRGSALRISPHLYNDAADAAALLDVLRASVVTA